MTKITGVAKYCLSGHFRLGHLMLHIDTFLRATQLILHVM